MSAKALSVLTMKILSYRAIYTIDFKHQLTKVVSQSYQEILKFVYPNAIKIGLTSLGGFLISQSSTLIGTLYLLLKKWLYME
ncbi:MAG: hypothetical protein Pg6B_06370 [Candidatus Azobacteroides pseudotrichonymphae]|jgi:hypothetical protein|uniref:hypothetical protein n=1 Tax=Candidatus Azobacteroides pseudotrichonymphae TaxID=511435 RepID=UPI00030B822A|nr:hypothetical protein [Candidatus Azobacteroides pseudotrichonymphae]MDR0530171.1 hypothetical protein [Bacteroidales bacterium OttesenSCG-928-I14]GMO35605.1 MAG: hypothetical protein Pg6B_06370 [Candidatus Azobacteroides pseudotrichonymphae]